MTGLRQGIAIASVLAAMALVVLDSSIANIALPAIAHSFRIAPAQSVWVVTAYQAALVMALLPAAQLAQAIGLRRTFAGGVALFALASLACAAAPSLGWLIAARFAQGLGGAAIMALGVALMRFTVGPERLGNAIGWNALTVALSSAAGPAIGGAILAFASWQWLFLVNLPLAALALAAASMLPAMQGDGRRIDLASIGLLAAGVACLVMAGEIMMHSALLATALLACGGATLALLWLRDSPKPEPLVPFDLLRLRAFRLSAIASVCCFAGQSGALVALPFHLQRTIGLDTVGAGLVLATWALSVAITGPISGHLSSRIETGALSATGCVILASGLAGFALWPAGAASPWLALPAIVCGAGFGLFQVPNNRNLFLSAPQARSAAAGGMQGTARLAGQTLGALGVTLLLANAAVDAATRTGIAAGAGVAIGAALASLARVPGLKAQAASSVASSP